MRGRSPFCPATTFPGNGAVTRTVVRDLTELLDRSLVGWIDDAVDFATSMVDRITPRTTDRDRDLVGEAQGYVDADPVPTEPYHEWVISGRFPAGRPRWEDAGALVVDDVELFEQRKLWLLNGSHSQLAYAGSILGHATIDQAIDDSDCRSWVEAFWDEASRHLEFSAAEIGEYRQALLTRFANPRVRDQLARIAADGSQKLRVRTVPVALAERAAGRLPVGCATTFAAWALHLRDQGAPVQDAGADAARAAAATDDLTEAVRGVLRTLEPVLADDDDFVAAVVAQAGLLSSRAKAVDLRCGGITGVVATKAHGPSAVMIGHMHGLGVPEGEGRHCGQHAEGSTHHRCPTQGLGAVRRNRHGKSDQ